MAQENVVLPIDKYRRLMEQVKKSSDTNKEENSKSQHNEEVKSRATNIKHNEEVKDSASKNHQTPKTSDTSNISASHVKEDNIDNNGRSSNNQEKSNTSEDEAMAAMPPGLNAEDMLKRTQAKRKPKLPKSLSHRLKGNKTPPGKKKRKKNRNSIYDNWIFFNKNK